MYAEYVKNLRQNALPPARRAPRANAVPTVKAQPYRSVNTYLDRISIAGLHNYLYARGKYEKITWNITFLLAIAGTLYYLVSPVQEYLDSTIVLDIQYQTEPSVRLPNPWVCHWAMNITYLRTEFEKAKPVLEGDKRLQLLAQRYQRLWNLSIPVTVDGLIWAAVRFVTTVSLYADDTDWIDDSRPQYDVEFISKLVHARGSSWPGTRAFYENGMLGCPEVVTNCSLNGVAFDCCRDDPMGNTRLLEKCFALVVREMAQERNLQHNQTKAIELKFETIIFDPSSEQFALESAETWHTTLSFGNRVDGLFDYNQVLQGGSESVINVKGIKKKKLANCMNTYRYHRHFHLDAHPIIREYFEDMVDPERYSVAACQRGKLYEALFLKCGCVPYQDSMRPQNDTDICTPVHLHACVYRAFQNEPPPISTRTAGDQSSRSTTEDDVKRDMFHIIKESIGVECLQLCESWTYDYTVFSTSIDDLEGNTSSINRTKITIVFDPEYLVATEVYKIDPAALIASVGDAFGLILGFSAVTLVQLPIWSIVAILFKRKQNKVSAMSKPHVAHSRASQQ